MRSTYRTSSAFFPLAVLLTMAACGEAGEVGPEGDDTSIHADQNEDDGEDEGA